MKKKIKGIVNFTLNKLPKKFNTHFLHKNTIFLLSLSILNFLGFELWIILQLFLNIKGITKSEVQRIVFKSLFRFYFITKQNKSRIE